MVRCVHCEGLEAHTAYNIGMVFEGRDALCLQSINTIYSMSSQHQAIKKVKFQQGVNYNPQDWYKHLREETVGPCTASLQTIH